MRGKGSDFYCRAVEIIYVQNQPEFFAFGISGLEEMLGRGLLTTPIRAHRLRGGGRRGCVRRKLQGLKDGLETEGGGFGCGRGLHGDTCQLPRGTVLEQA